MFLHLGGDVTVSSKKIIAILDAEQTGLSEDNRALLDRAKKDSATVYISDEHKSIVILENNKRTRVYYSPISPATLTRRSAFVR